MSRFEIHHDQILINVYQNSIVRSHVKCCMCVEQVDCKHVYFNEVTYECSLSTVPTLAIGVFAQPEEHSDILSKVGTYLG